MINTIIFDFGGVISLSQDKNKVRKICKILRIKEDQLKSVYQYVRKDYDSGLISAKEYWEKVIQSLAIEKTISEKEFNTIINLDQASWMKINRDVVKLIKELKKKGLYLAIFSNMPANMLSYINRRFKWMVYFDYKVFSCEEKINKPDIQIYKIMLSKLHEKPEKILFIDDSYSNIEIAARLGLNTIHYKSKNDLKKELSKNFGIV